jgi:hypothetical protein
MLKRQKIKSVHKYPLGKQIAKAFLPTDWIFFKKNSKMSRIIKKHPSGEAHTFPKKVKITFRIQKIRQNGQSIMLACDDNHPNICPIRAAYRILLHAIRLGQNNEKTLAV